MMMAVCTSTSEDSGVDNCSVIVITKLSRVPYWLREMSRLYRHVWQNSLTTCCNLQKNHIPWLLSMTMDSHSKPVILTGSLRHHGCTNIMASIISLIAPATVITSVTPSVTILTDRLPTKVLF